MVQRIIWVYKEKQAMMQSADQYMRAWESSESAGARYNSRIIAGTCVLETLAMVNEPDMRYVFVDDFGYAVAYCRQRLREDLTPPDQWGGDEPLVRWRRMRSAFAPEDLASVWAATDVAFAALIGDFVAGGYMPLLGERLREIVNAHGLDLELGEIYVLPEDIQALLARVGKLFAEWDEVGRTKRTAPNFDAANAWHRAALARRLREANGAGEAGEAGLTYKPYRALDLRDLSDLSEDHALN